MYHQTVVHVRKTAFLLRLADSIKQHDWDIVTKMFVLNHSDTSNIKFTEVYGWFLSAPSWLCVHSPVTHWFNSGYLLLLVGGGGDGAVGIHHRLGTPHHRQHQEETQEEEEEKSEAKVHVNLKSRRRMSSLVHVGDEDSWSPFNETGPSLCQLSNTTWVVRACAPGLLGRWWWLHTRNTEQKNR